MIAPSPQPTRRQARRLCAFGVLTLLVSAGLLGAVAIVPAPPMVVPFAVVVCLGLSLVAAHELPRAVAVLHDAARARAELRRQLDELPETRHPLGL